MADSIAFNTRSRVKQRLQAQVENANRAQPAQENLRRGRQVPVNQLVQNREVQDNNQPGYRQTMEVSRRTPAFRRAPTPTQR